MLERALLRETQFGTGATLRERADHDVLDDGRWSVTPLVRNLRQKADRRSSARAARATTSWSSGGSICRPATSASRPGSYLALLSHSGSRGPGATIADHYTKLARALHPELPKELSHLAWLDLDSEPGQEYWAAMNLMGDYAAANHEIIHAPPRAAPRRRACWPASRTTTTSPGTSATAGATWSSTARARRRPARACSASSPARWPRPASSCAAAARRRASSRRATARAA